MPFMLALPFGSYSFYLNYMFKISVTEGLWVVSLFLLIFVSVLKTKFHWVLLGHRYLG